MDKRKVCVITGTRADYGFLFWLMKDLQQDPDFILQIIATGMHLSPEFGLTYRVIEEDGFSIDEKVEMLLSSDTPTGICKSVGLAVIGMSEALHRLDPDLLILIGDRYEMLAAAQAALVHRIPVAHIAGGDTTEGAIDEAIRHSITKMSHLHFVTNEESARRVRQMGEDPRNIFNVGSPSLDYIHRMRFLSKEELEEILSFKFCPTNAVVTFHPVTLDPELPEVQFAQLLEALTRMHDMGIIFTMPNADTYGRKLMDMIENFVSTHSNAVAFTSLGQLRYLSLLKTVDVVIGNSSSGLYEAPSFRIPTVNIGNRQKGRLQASSIINCDPSADEIYEAIQKALSLDCSSIENPYGDGHSSARILKHLKGLKSPKQLLQKHFHWGSQVNE